MHSSIDLDRLSKNGIHSSAGNTAMGAKESMQAVSSSKETSAILEGDI
jgi:hypothetical protein